MLYSSTWSPSGGGGTAGHESNALTIDAAIIFIRLQHLPRQPHRHALAESQGHAFAANQSRMLPPATCSRCGSSRKHVAAPGSPRPQRSEQPCSSIALFVIFFTSVTLSRFSTLAFLIRSGIVSRVASQGLSIALVQPAPGHARPQHLSEARPLPSPPNTLIPPRRCRRSRFRRRTRVVALAIAALATAAAPDVPDGVGNRPLAQPAANWPSARPSSDGQVLMM